MTEQEENELICTKLLGWKRTTHSYPGWWTGGDLRSIQNHVPSFNHWADAGLILEAFVARSVEVTLNGDSRFKNAWICELTNGGSEAHPSAPLSIRAAALAYIQTGKCPPLPKDEDDKL